MRCQECNGRGHFLFAMSTPTCDVCGGTGVVGAEPLFVPEPTHWLCGEVVAGVQSGLFPGWGLQPVSLTKSDGIFFNKDKVSFESDGPSITAEYLTIWNLKWGPELQILNWKMRNPIEIHPQQTLTFAPGAIQIPESDV